MARCVYISVLSVLLPRCDGVRHVGALVRELIVIHSQFERRVTIHVYGCVDHTDAESGTTLHVLVDGA